MADHPPPLTRSVAETAELLGVGRRRVYDLIHAGYLKTLPGPGSMAVLTESIDELIERARRSGPDPRAAAS